jgi:dolichyl-phosphate-mannose--protein O-mannosyl transferase
MTDDSTESPDPKEPALPAPPDLLWSLSGFRLRPLAKLFASDRPSEPLRLTTVDSIALIFFMSLGMLTRFFKIHFPQTVVFDEIHFGNFTNWYIRGEYFHDIHPPLAKLIMAGVARYAGYTATINFEAIKATDKYPDMIYVALRSTPAFFGAMCIPLAYLAVRAMGGRPFAAAVSAFMVASDLMLIVEARHILSDGILHFFACLSLFTIFLYERYPQPVYLIAEGLALGCAAACKYTSGGLVLLAFLRQLDLRHPLSFIARSGVLVAAIVLVHVLCFWVHLGVLPFNPVDVPGMPASVRAALVERANPNWAAREEAPPVLLRIVQLVLHMHRGNMKISGRHPYASPWWSWPLAWGRWVLYWTLEGKHIICMANILLWYPVLAGVIWNGVRICLTRDISSEESGAFFGWAFSYLPFALIPREMFLYHYAIPLIVGIYNLNLMMERHLAPRIRGFCFCLALAMAVFGFLFWCPWAYGLSTPEFNFLVWNDRWRR